MKINLCLLGCPLPPYIKEPRGGGGRPRRARQGGVLLPPFFPSWRRRSGKEEEEGKERGGAAPLSLSYSDLGGEGCAATSFLLSSSPLGPM